MEYYTMEYHSATKRKIGSFVGLWIDVESHKLKKVCYALQSEVCQKEKKKKKSILMHICRI